MVNFSSNKMVDFARKSAIPDSFDSIRLPVLIVIKNWTVGRPKGSFEPRKIFSPNLQDKIRNIKPGFETSPRGDYGVIRHPCILSASQHKHPTRTRLLHVYTVLYLYSAVYGLYMAKETRIIYSKQRQHMYNNEFLHIQTWTESGVTINCHMTVT